MSPKSPLQVYEKCHGPKRLGEMWSMSKGPHAIACTLATHPMGWELRLASGDNFFRAQVCKSEATVFETSDAWRAQAAEKGWA